MIGLIIPDIENAFFSSLAKAIEMYGREQGYIVLLMNNHDSHRTNLEVIELLLQRNIDGLMLVLRMNPIKNHIIQNHKVFIESNDSIYPHRS